MASKDVDYNNTQHEVRFMDIEEKSNRKLMPIQGYAEVPLVSIEQAVDPLVSIVHDVKNMANCAKWTCADHPSDKLTKDQSAAIILYSMDWQPREKCLYFVLNATLRDENRQKLKPWFLFLKLFLTALSHLPSIHRTVYRGIKRDLRHEYQPGQTIIWWGFSSCTDKMSVLKNEQFLGATGRRTLFAIDCDSGKDIRQHSVFQNEDEILLPAARQFQVVSTLPQGNDLCIIQLREIKSPVHLIELVPETSATTATTTTQNVSSNMNIENNTEVTASSLSLQRPSGLIILGNSGVGKSFLANILLGREAFIHNASPKAVTTRTEFEEISIGNDTYAIFNIPGLIEADQSRIETNKVEIDKAFKERPLSLIIFVFGSQGGRIRDEDVVAFNALNKAYPFDLESLVFVVNQAPKKRPEDYEGEVSVLLEKLTNVPRQTLCVLDIIDQDIEDEKQKLKNKLFQVIVTRTAHVHKKKQDIELRSEEVRKAKEEIKALQAAFQQNRQTYEEKIKEQQTKYGEMFQEIQSENESLRILIEQQANEVREFQNLILEKEAAYKKEQEHQYGEHHKDMVRLQRAYEEAIQEAKTHAAEQKAKEEAHRKEQEVRDAEHREDMRKMQIIIQEANERAAEQKAKEEAHRKEQERRDAEHREEIQKLEREHQEAIQEAHKRIAEQESKEEAYRKVQTWQDAEHREDMQEMQRTYQGNKRISQHKATQKRNPCIL